MAEVPEMQAQPSFSCGVPEGGSGESSRRMLRREVVKVLAGLGIGTAVFRRALAAAVQNGRQITPDMIRQAEWIAGLELTEEQRTAAARGVGRLVRSLEAMRSVPLEHRVPPALHFAPRPEAWLRGQRGVPQGAVTPTEAHEPQRPASPEDLAFLPVVELAALLRSGKVTSLELTHLYLDRLRRYDPVLRCVVTLTEETALRQAEAADREIAVGRYRGPLHGIPWGAKDLIAYPGYKTTWGAAPFREQVLNFKATVAQRLEQAGAVLVAKLSLGALAQGDRWFGGMTRNPWNPEEGSSGSSAGSAAAAAAGLVGFALGSETLGSIVSPCRRCGTTGLRPTFGRVSRYGCMTLSWSMDKIGPICRTVEDCALVFGAIQGPDGLDPTVVDLPFAWPCRRDIRTFRVGYTETGTPVDDRPELRTLAELGVRLVPLRLPDQFPAAALTLILDVEAATVFDQLVRDGVTDGLNAWPNTLRDAQFVPAVEYLRANRIRSLLIQAMEAMFDATGIDCYVEGDDLVVTNLTGHPSVALPGGFQQRNGVRVPRVITFTGRLYGESELLAVAHAFQQATGYHLERPPLKLPGDNDG